MVNIVPLSPHDLVIKIDLGGTDHAVFQTLVTHYHASDPRFVFWKAWEQCAVKEFGKVRYRKWIGMSVPKHTTKLTDGVVMRHGHAPFQVSFQFQHFMDLLLMSMVLGRRHETDPAVVLCQNLRELGDEVMGKVAMRKLTVA